jgi:hypothetical protein
VKILEFFQHMPEGAGLEDASAMAKCVPDFKEEVQTHELNLKARGLKENMAQAIVAMKAIFH